MNANAIGRKPQRKDAESRMALRLAGSTVSSPTEGGAMKEIVIATDGSEAAREAVEYGLELASENGAAVTFVHVLPPDDYVVPGRGGPGIPRPHHVDMDESEGALAEASDAAIAAGVSYALERISGDTVAEIVAVAEAKDADLIVVGSRGRGTVSSALLGSVSRGVLKEASRPVLVIRVTAVPAETAV
jgi:nucleotide-binding universal stress UspA family protein